MWREGLWEKMDKYGLGCKFLRVCQALCSSVQARVRVGSTLSEEFEEKCRLRQGCVCSFALPFFYLYYGSSLGIGGEGIRGECSG